MKKKILVLMSTYNGEKYISQQIDSILNQDCEHEIKLRIRDDGSSDDTVAIIKNYVSRFPNKIELIQGGNIGLNASFFNLIKNASGYDFYSLSDQDDIWLPNKLQVATSKIEKENKEMPLLYASISYLVHDDLIPYGVTRKKLRDFSIFNTIIQNICPGHTQVFNNLLLEYLKVDIDISNIYVYDSWITNIAILYGKILFDIEPNTLYRQHQSNNLGYGKGYLGRLITSYRHFENGDCLKYMLQAKYFIEKNKEELVKYNYYNELEKLFVGMSFMQKLKNIINSKIFRQNIIETILFKLCILVSELDFEIKNNRTKKGK